MPRLNSTDYLHHRLRVTQLYKEQPAAFSYLSRRAQSDLHAYFQTTKLGTDSELLEERATLTAQDRSLPQRAGRALKALKTAQSQDPRPRARVPAAAGGRKIYVRAVMRADPDATQLLHALLRLAEAKTKAEQDEAA